MPEFGRQLVWCARVVVAHIQYYCITYLYTSYTYYCSFTCTVVSVQRWHVIVCHRRVLPPYPRHVACVPRRTTTTLFYFIILVDFSARLTFVFRPCFQLRLARCTTGVYCPPGPYGWAPSSYPTTTINHCRRQVRLRARRRWDIHKYSITIIIHTARIHNDLNV